MSLSNRDIPGQVDDLRPPPASPLVGFGAPPASPLVGFGIVPGSPSVGFGPPPASPLVDLGLPPASPYGLASGGIDRAPLSLPGEHARGPRAAGVGAASVTGDPVVLSFHSPIRAADDSWGIQAGTDGVDGDAKSDGAHDSADEMDQLDANARVDMGLAAASSSSAMVHDARPTLSGRARSRDPRDDALLDPNAIVQHNPNVGAASKASRVATNILGITDVQIANLKGRNKSGGSAAFLSRDANNGRFRVLKAIAEAHVDAPSRKRIRGSNPSPLNAVYSIRSLMCVQSAFYRRMNMFLTNNANYDGHQKKESNVCMHWFVRGFLVTHENVGKAVESVSDDGWASNMKRFMGRIPPTNKESSAAARRQNKIRMLRLIQSIVRSRDPDLQEPELLRPARRGDHIDIGVSSDGLMQSFDAISVLNGNGALILMGSSYSGVFRGSSDSSKAHRSKLLSQFLNPDGSIGERVLALWKAADQADGAHEDYIQSSSIERAALLRDLGACRADEIAEIKVGSKRIDNADEDMISRLPFKAASPSESMDELFNGPCLLTLLAQTVSFTSAYSILENAARVFAISLRGDDISPDDPTVFGPDVIEAMNNPVAYFKRGDIAEILSHLEKFAIGLVSPVVYKRAVSVERLESMRASIEGTRNMDSRACTLVRFISQIRVAMARIRSVYTFMDPENEMEDEITLSDHPDEDGYKIRALMYLVILQGALSEFVISLDLVASDLVTGAMCWTAGATSARDLSVRRGGKKRSVYNGADSLMAMSSASFISSLNSETIPVQDIKAAIKLLIEREPQKTKHRQTVDSMVGAINHFTESYDPSTGEALGEGLYDIERDTYRDPVKRLAIACGWFNTPLVPACLRVRALVSSLQGPKIRALADLRNAAIAACRRMFEDSNADCGALLADVKDACERVIGSISLSPQTSRMLSLCMGIKSGDAPITSYFDIPATTGIDGTLYRTLSTNSVDLPTRVFASLNELSIRRGYVKDEDDMSQPVAPSGSMRDLFPTMPVRPGPEGFPDYLFRVFCDHPAVFSVLPCERPVCSMRDPGNMNVRGWEYDAPIRMQAEHDLLCASNELVRHTSKYVRDFMEIAYSQHRHESALSYRQKRDAFGFGVDLALVKAINDSTTRYSKIAGQLDAIASRPLDMGAATQRAQLLLIPRQNILSTSEPGSADLLRGLGPVGLLVFNIRTFADNKFDCIAASYRDMLLESSDTPLVDERSEEEKQEFARIAGSQIARFDSVALSDDPQIRNRQMMSTGIGCTSFVAHVTELKMLFSVIKEGYTSEAPVSDDAMSRVVPGYSYWALDPSGTRRVIESNAGMVARFMDDVSKRVALVNGIVGWSGSYAAGLPQDGSVDAFFDPDAPFLLPSSQSGGAWSPRVSPRRSGALDPSARSDDGDDRSLLED